MARDRYLLEELDDATTEYLRAVRRDKGERLAGIYVGTDQYGPGCMLIAGPIVMIAALWFASTQLDDPTNVAMLLTAGILLGGWLTLAAIRISISRGRETNLGSFFYADPWHLWMVSGTKVEHIDLDGVAGATAIETRNNEGAYQASILTLQTSSGVETISLAKEIGAREIQAYIEFWIGKRGGRLLSPVDAESFAAGAKAYAYDQQAPLNAKLPIDIPKPEKVREAGFGWLNLALVTAVGVGLFYVLQPLVIQWRDDAVFDLVRSRPPNELRAYLVDARNTRHRQQVQTLLAGHYVAPIAKVKERIQNNGDPKLAEFADPMETLLQSIAEAAQPIITVRVRGKQPDNPFDANPLPTLQRAAAVKTMIADSLLGAIGPDKLSIADAPEGVPALIEVDYEIVPDAGQPTVRLDTTVTIRKSPDNEPLIRRTWQRASFAPQSTDEVLRSFVKAITGGDPAGPLPNGGEW